VKSRNLREEVPPDKCPSPLVTALIVTRNRPDELRLTLRRLQEQDYEPIELIVVDDNSDQPLAGIVAQEWPTGKALRNDKNLGPSESRSLGMGLARGLYILSLDDDSCLTDPQDLKRAVLRMTAGPQIGALAFLIHNGPLPPESAEHAGQECLLHTFIACGAMIRAEVVRSLGGYHNFYGYYGEENEYALRMIANGWSVTYFPSVVVHHRVSPLGRPQGRMWALSLRNNIWTIALHLPARRVPVEICWKLAVGLWDATRLLRIHWLGWACGSAAAGLPRILKLRKPISP